MCEYHEVDMQELNDVVAQIRTIMQTSGYSQNALINALDGKVARNTIMAFLKGEADCKVSTLLLMLDAIRADLRIDTEMSKEALMSGDISEYRTQTERYREQLEDAIKSRDFLQTRYEELIDKNTALTRTIEKQQEQIDRYIERMDRAEQNIERKDKRIVELSQRLGLW